MNMTSDVNFTSISAISGLTPITVNFLLSTIPVNASKIVFDFGDGSKSTVNWFVSSAPASSVSAWPISADIGNIKNYITTKTFIRDSVNDPSLYTINISAYDTVSFIPTAYQIEVGPISLKPLSSTDFSDLRIVKTKYINKNKLLIVFEDQISGNIYPVFTDPNFDS